MKGDCTVLQAVQTDISAVHYSGVTFRSQILITVKLWHFYVIFIFPEVNSFREIYLYTTEALLYRTRTGALRII